MSVGQELLDVPLPAMVAKLGLGIADAQRALDDNSIETLQALNKADKIDVISSITRTISQDGEVTYESYETEMTPFQLGVMPTFYQFSEATIDVTMDIKTTSQTDTSVKVGAEAKAGWGLYSASVRTDVEHNRKFGKEVHGTSQLTTKLVPVPPPERIEPEFYTVDNREEADPEKPAGTKVEDDNPS